MALSRFAFGFACSLSSACAFGGRAAPETPNVDASALLPARVRALSNIELENSVDALLGGASGLAARLPPDVRQAGYTRNAGQTWTAARAVRWATLVDEHVDARAKASLQTLWPCGEHDVACHSRTVEQAMLRAWRRPATTAEQRGLLRVYTTLRADGEVGAVAALYSALMQAPSFVYASELGEPSRQVSSRVRLSSYELASQLSYMLQGKPPDALLLEAAADGSLAIPSEREKHAWRLLEDSDTRHQFRRFVLEWLEVDRLLDSAKDSGMYADFERLKPKMLAETSNYVDEVLVFHGASLRALLDSGFTSVDPAMARYYGLEAYGAAVPLTGTGRRGVLQHASVLAAHSHPDITSPVKRGDFILRRVLCLELARPGEVGIEVVMPRPVPGQSGRERISAHSVNPGCASCHDYIDPLGFTFENFDAAGAARQQDGAGPPDTRVKWSYEDVEHEFADSEALARWLAQQPQSQACFERQAFRYFSGQSNSASEDAFIALSERLPAKQQGNLLALLVEYVKSDLFVWRRKS